MDRSPNGWRAGARAIVKPSSGSCRSSTTSCGRSPVGSFDANRPNHTLSATALVHEVYLRLLHQRQLTATDRDNFLAIAAQTMRRILVDHARARSRLKRGGDDRPIQLENGDDEPLLSDTEVEEVLAIDVALDRLAQIDERAHRVIECRIFAGLTLDETAQALGVSSKSVQRTWTTARAWLRKELGRDLPAG